ncbi:hypothetical protein ACU61A_36230 [Pseudonocardia sichuanensis]|uniref:hypothetical protein n=1 Tax=Pseudonocardia kunmingensis TaxID=630975 RepID=UPI001151F08B|nr:hypothetical protein [Pseudonocardia kunmingensis]
MTAEWGTARPPRGSIALPALRRPSTQPPAGVSAKPSSAEVAAAGRAAVTRAVEYRGGTVREVRNGRRTELLVQTPTGRWRVRVLTRRRGDWQTSIREGANPAPRANAVWAFVDLANGATRYYVAPEPWVVNDIRTEHEDYLARNGGQRVVTKDSEHHGIKTARVECWLGRWDLLGLADPEDADAG